jgi:hypothetical protein
MLKTLKTSSLIHLHLLQLCYLRINWRLVDYAAAAAKYVSATKKGCHNVFTKTVGIIEDEKLGGNKTGIFVLNAANVVQSIVNSQLKQKYQLVCIYYFFIANNKFIYQLIFLF